MRAFQWLWLVLVDQSGGIGDDIMAAAILGAGSKSVFTNLRTGFSTLGTTISTSFSTTTIP